MALNTQNESTVKESSITMGSVINELIGLQAEKHSKYRDSPVNILPVSYWLNQIAIKSIRAEQCIESDDIEDNLMDTIAYCLMTIVKIRGGKV